MSVPEAVSQFSQSVEASQGNHPITKRLTSAWAYIRHELLYLCYALVEVSLLTPLALSLMGWARYWPPQQVLLWLLLLMLLPFNLTRLMSLIGLDRTRQVRIMVVALLLTVLISWRTLLYAPASALDFGWLRQFFSNVAETGSLVWTRDLSIFLLVLFVWWRGLRLGTRHHEINRMGLRLRLGGLIFAPIIIWFAANFLAWSVVPYLMLFFLAALTAVALVRVEQMEQEQTGNLASLNVSWLLMIMLAALAITLTAAIVASIISGESLLFVVDWLAPLWVTLQFGTTATGLTLYYLSQPLLDLFAILIQALGAILVYILGQAGEAARQLIQVTGGEVPIPTVTPTATEEVSNVGGKAIVLVLMLLAIVLVTFALARLYRQASFVARESGRSHLDSDDEETASAGRGLLERLGVLRSWRAALSIRRIYRQMCRAAEGAGYPRPEFQTPYEYLPTLAIVWPENTADSRLITNAFVKVRYGEVPESREELEAIRAAWRQLEATEPNRRESDATTKPRLLKKG